MAVYADRVKETTTTTGTGTYSLDGAASGFRTFVAGVGTGQVVTYVVENGTDWEVGEGTVTDATPDTLTRTTILASSNAGAAVNWGAGSKNVFLTAAAARTVFTDRTNTFTAAQVLPGGSNSSPSITFSGDTDTGFYKSANEVVDIAITGQRAFSVAADAAVSGAQNYLAFYSTNTGGSPYMVPAGGDANIHLTLYGKGTGGLRLCGTATTVSGSGAISTSEAFIHSGSTAHTISTTGAVSFTGAVVQSTKGFAAAEYSAGSGAPGTITWSNGQNQVRTLTSSGTMTFASPTAGATYKLRIVQGGSGSYTITWPTIKWAGGAAPTLSTAVGAIDIVTLYYNGTDYYGQAATGFA